MRLERFPEWGNLQLRSLKTPVCVSFCFAATYINTYLYTSTDEGKCQWLFYYFLKLKILIK